MPLPQGLDFIAPPFAGHLFPLLDLAMQLRKRGVEGIRVLSTQSARESAERCGLDFVELLPGMDARVQEIANPGTRVGSHPLRMLRQFRANLGLMAEMRNQLDRIWQSRRPGLALVDFTVPVAGLLARHRGIPWWTSLPTPCALETRSGTPSYLGGWTPRGDPLGRVRDAAGRCAIRAFKRAVAWCFAGRLRDLHVPRLYRPDGSEWIYSPDRIFGLGMREFEFERDWPEPFTFLGPLTGGPRFPHAEPEFPPGKRYIFVSLGTHVDWAKGPAAERIQQVAAKMDDCVFHFSYGRPGQTGLRIEANVHFHAYVPYDLYLPRYHAAIIHGGTGITYSCIKAGVPVLVWPQDYDQFDHAARIVNRGLGLRLEPEAARISTLLRQILDVPTFRRRAQEFQVLARQYHPADRFAAEVTRLLPEGAASGSRE